MTAKKKLARKSKNGSKSGAKLRNDIKVDKVKLIKAAQKISTHAVSVEQTVTTYTKQHPLQVIGLSVLAGLIVGQVFRC